MARYNPNDPLLEDVVDDIAQKGVPLSEYDDHILDQEIEQRLTLQEKQEYWTKNWW